MTPKTCHIDHIVPLSKFDFTIPEHQLVACHYLNLRPLDAFENMSKADNLPDNWQEKIFQICEIRNINPQPIIEHIESEVYVNNI